MKATQSANRSFLLACLLAFPLEAGAAAASSRIVAVGDVHGEAGGFQAILQATDLVDRRLRWVGGNATLVQTGDLLDRGAETRAVLDLLMRLQKEAKRAKGRVVVLLGNHEMMTVMSDLRYVAADDYASFADGDSARRQEEAFAAERRLHERRRQADGAGAAPAPEREAWMAAHPAGFLERAAAFSPAGSYGRWLRRLPALAIIDDTVFVHGGIAPASTGLTGEEIVRRVSSEIETFDTLSAYLVERGVILPHYTLAERTAATRAELLAAEAAAAGHPGAPSPEEEGHRRRLEAFLSLAGWLGVRADGPLWFRGFGQWSEEEGAAPVAAALAALGARRFVVGHTTREDGRIGVRFGGSVFLIDTGMLAGYVPGGRPSALEIGRRAIEAVYLDGRTPLGDRAALPAAGAAATPPTGRWLGPDGTPLPFADDDQVLAFLRTARVVSSEYVGSGITRPKKVLLEQDGVTMHAIFRYLDQEKDEMRLPGGRELKFRDSYLFECAAYELSRLLGTGSVPPAVRRSILGQDGSLQIWVEGAMTGTKRQRESLAPPDDGSWRAQMDRMAVWDALVANIDRNTGNFIIDRDWRVWLIDHTRAFRRDRDLRHPEEISRCDRELLDGLRRMRPDEVRVRLKPYLRGNEIDALIARCGRLVARIEGLVGERGEEAVVDAPLASPVCAAGR